MPSSPTSIQTRQLLTIAAGVLSLIASHFILDAVYRETVVSDARSRLTEFAAHYAAATAADVDGRITVAPGHPDPRFARASSGLYAVMLHDGKRIWSTPSAPPPAQVPAMPSASSRGALASKSSVFAPALGNSSIDKNMNRYRLNALAPGDKSLLTVLVYEDATTALMRMQAFNFAAWGSLWGSIFLLLLAQSISSRWTLRPLSGLLRDVDRVRSGESRTLTGSYPEELSGLASSMNAMIEHDAERVLSHRSSLANLAHSLKTPLAVLRATIDNNPAIDPSLSKAIAEQIARMDEQVNYQLAFAARTGATTFAQPIPLEPVAIEIVSSLEKLHAGRGILCEFDLPEDLTVRAARGDIQELLGNLLENAFKWSTSRVSLSARQSLEGTLIAIEDDGPGIMAKDRDQILQRHHRVDERVSGHGLGLAIVADIVMLYRGRITVTDPVHLQGARFEVLIPGAPK